MWTHIVKLTYIVLITISIIFDNDPIICNITEKDSLFYLKNVSLRMTQFQRKFPPDLRWLLPHAQTPLICIQLWNESATPTPAPF